MIELELTYLARYVPSDLRDYPSKKIIDLYIENGTDHADLRVRKNGDKYELTRKTPVSEGDASVQEEITIKINKREFESFESADSRRVEKTRYLYNYKGRVVEFDIFEGFLEGLVVVDFEFNSENEKDSFAMPDFCLVDITQESFIAGGILAGKHIEDINDDLVRLSYKELVLI